MDGIGVVGNAEIAEPFLESSSTFEHARENTNRTTRQVNRFARSPFFGSRRGQLYCKLGMKSPRPSGVRSKKFHTGESRSNMRPPSSPKAHTE